MKKPDFAAQYRMVLRLLQLGTPELQKLVPQDRESGALHVSTLNRIRSGAQLPQQKTWERIVSALESRLASLPLADQKAIAPEIASLRVLYEVATTMPRSAMRSRRVALLSFASAGWVCCFIVAFALWPHPKVEVAPWSFPNDAGPVRELARLRGMANLDFEADPEKGTPVPGWIVDSNKGLNVPFALIDDTVRHSGSRSLKLVQRFGSGTLRQQLPFLLPAGSTVIFGAWILSPRGGSPDNKWISLSICGDQGVPLATTDCLDPTPEWKRFVVQATLQRASSRCFIELNAGNGVGRHRGWDWATWVDDLFVGVTIHLQPVNTNAKLTNGLIVQYAELPAGYNAEDIDLDKPLTFEEEDSRHQAPARLEKNTNGDPGRVSFSCDEPAEVKLLTSPDAEEQVEAFGEIWGRFNRGGYTIPFCVSCRGTPITRVNPPARPTSPKRKV